VYKILILASIFASEFIFASGASIYTSKCASCHGSKGETSAYKKTKPITGQDSALTYKQLNGYKNGTLNQYGFGGVMKNMVDNLDDNSIKEIASYISKLK
jgi:cytochrome c553